MDPIYTVKDISRHMSDFHGVYLPIPLTFRAHEIFHFFILSECTWTAPIASRDGGNVRPPM